MCIKKSAKESVIMIFSIPAINYQNVLKVYKRLKKKSDIISRLDVVRSYFQNVSIFDKFGGKHTATLKFYDIDVEGKYENDTYDFVAVLEHKPNGNIIRQVNNNITIPEFYKTCPAYCEHCGTVRNRKDTYLVYNKKGNKLIQVGKSCLKDFTDLDLPAVAEYNRFCDYMDNFGIVEERIVISNENKFINAELFKKVAYQIIEKNGYKIDVVSISKM